MAEGKRIEAFIIHLDRAVERRMNVARLSADLAAATGVPVQVISAVDGHILTEGAIASVFQPNLHTPPYPFVLSNGEIACFMSHRKCWQEIVDRNLDAALIVEDDVEVTPEFTNCWQLAITYKGGFIRFAKNMREKVETPIVAKAGVTHFIPKVVGLGMIGQLVDRQTAKRLLSCTQPFDRPVDTFLQMFWLTGIKPSVVQPMAFGEISAKLGGSTVQAARRPAFANLAREWMRFMYRSRINRLSASHRLSG